jgi:LemA protein
MPKPSAASLLEAGAPEGEGANTIVLPAYDQCIKASHIFNLLDARGVISVTERQSYILKVRELAKACGAAWLNTRAGGATMQPIRPPRQGTVPMEWIIFALIIAVVGYGIVIYNALVKSRQMVREGWSGISVQLQRRSDLIPNLLETVKGYMGHEKEVLENVTALRARAQAVGDEHPAERAGVESLLGAALGRLMAVAEAYPDLKASTNFKEFQDALEETEDKLQLARRYYNGAVRSFNTQVEQFPSNLVANQFRFQQAEYFELEDPADRAAPQVSFS